MDGDDLHRWLQAYGDAWEKPDPDAMASLFTEDATYWETPYSTHMKGRDEIRAYMAKVPEFQKDVRFGFEILSAEPALARWWATYIRIADGDETKLDGIFLLEFEGGLCRTPREWWHADPYPSF